MKKITIDGVGYEVDSPAFDQAFAKYQARQDSIAAEYKALTEKVETLEKTIADNKRADAKDFEDKVSSAVQLRVDARDILGSEEDITGKTDREIMTLAVKKTDESFDAEGKSDDYLRARFDLAKVQTTKRRDELDKVHNDLQDFGKKTQGAKPTEDLVTKARNDAKEKASKAWEQPLAVSTSK